MLSPTSSQKGSASRELAASAAVAASFNQNEGVSGITVDSFRQETALALMSFAAGFWLLHGFMLSMYFGCRLYGGHWCHACRSSQCAADQEGVAIQFGFLRILRWSFFSMTLTLPFLRCDAVG